MQDDLNKLRETLLYHLETEEVFGLDRLPLIASRAPQLEPSAPEVPAPDVPAPDTPAPDTPAPDPIALLRERVAGCTLCPLHTGRNHTVFGEGDLDAELLFIGEAPGRDEDLSGLPFVGRAGQLLTRMISAMGFDREDVFIGNVLKCRPPNNRTPAIDEIACCLPYLKEQIERLAPCVIVALGAPAARTLIDSTAGIMTLRGRVYDYRYDRAIRVVPTFHPAYLLRTPADKPKTWHDLKLAMKILESGACRQPASARKPC